MNEPFSTIYNTFGWLADFYALDYFVESHWNRMPKSWQIYFQECLKICSESKILFFELIENITNLNLVNLSPKFMRAGPPPLSYLALRKSILLMAYLHRRHVKNFTELNNALGFPATKNFGDFTQLKRVLAPELCRKIKAKKSHEIGRLNDLIALLIEQLKIDKKQIFDEKLEVVDVGAGLGHLSRLLAYLLPVNVSTIEGDSKLVMQSHKLDVKFEERLKKQTHQHNNLNLNGIWPVPKRRIEYIGVAEQISIDNLSKIPIKNELENDCLILGLHACGDLSSTILRHFVQNKSAKILISVACCYHKLNQGQDRLYRDQHENISSSSSSTYNITGYPLSSKFQHLKLSYASRELASFSRERFLKKIPEQILKSFDANCYRALLEWLILDCPQVESLENLEPQLRHQGLRSVPQNSKLDFWDYVKEALKDKPVLLVQILEKRSNEFVLNKLSEWQKSEGEKIVIIGALRILLAPLIETIILEDRREFLLENKIIYSRLVPLFNENISPRNICLVSIKNL